MHKACALEKPATKCRRKVDYEVMITRSVMDNERLVKKIGDTYLVGIMHLVSVTHLEHLRGANNVSNRGHSTF
jgi:hypothetical protein